jgi:UPF0755 protein
VRQREREPLTEQDPHSLLFGHDEDGSLDHEPGSGPLATADHPPRRAERHEHARRRRTRRHRRVFGVLTAFVVIVIVVISVAGYHVYQNRYHPSDYSGAGTGSVSIIVRSGEDASAIGRTLRDKGVVASVRAFTNAADRNSKSQSISPGTYQLRGHMSARNAVQLMLDPASRLSNQVTVFEGATVLDVGPPLAKALGISQAEVSAAIDNVGALGLPQGYASGGQSPPSVEGFLYPATYSFDPGTDVQDALQLMVTQFTEKARATGFTLAAKALKVSPYEALIVASIAEKEAKLASDYPKVARVILNRIAGHKALQIDATSAYAAKLKKLNPSKVVYAKIDSPYNTYTHRALPPTPISSPGQSALAAAVHPAAGNWLYYVNGDANGDLFFTNSETAFAQAVEKCRTNHWGCG